MIGMTSGHTKIATAARWRQSSLARRGWRYGRQKYHRSGPLGRRLLGRYRSTVASATWAAPDTIAVVERAQSSEDLRNGHHCSALKLAQRWLALNCVSVRRPCSQYGAAFGVRKRAAGQHLVRMHEKASFVHQMSGRREFGLMRYVSRRLSHGCAPFCSWVRCKERRSRADALDLSSLFLRARGLRVRFRGLNKNNLFPKSSAAGAL